MFPYRDNSFHATAFRVRKRFGRAQSEKSTMLVALYFTADKSAARQTNRIPISAFAFDESINVKIPPMY